MQVFKTIIPGLFHPLELTKRKTCEKKDLG